jgi:hypothetical protein
MYVPRFELAKTSPKGNITHGIEGYKTLTQSAKKSNEGIGDERTYDTIL